MSITRKEIRKEMDRAHADVWRLDIDIPGNGCFEEASFNKDMRSFQVGAWARCFACGIVSKGYKCNGTCDKNVFYCSTDCQKRAWRLHKEETGCRRKNDTQELCDSFSKLDTQDTVIQPEKIIFVCDDGEYIINSPDILAKKKNWKGVEPAGTIFSLINKQKKKGKNTNL